MGHDFPKRGQQIYHEGMLETQTDNKPLNLNGEE